jgi:pimeloyl-ACP methyl ester carboxylesterase
MGFLGQLAAASFHSSGAALSRIACPTEVITGDSDEIIPPANSRVLAERIPGAVLTVVAEAGHVFPLEHPRELPRAIARVQRRIER